MRATLRAVPVSTGAMPCRVAPPSRVVPTAAIRDPRARAADRDLADRIDDVLFGCSAAAMALPWLLLVVRVLG